MIGTNRRSSGRVGRISGLAGLVWAHIRRRALEHRSCRERVTHLTRLPKRTARSRSFRRTSWPASAVIRWQRMSWPALPWRRLWCRNPWRMPKLPACLRKPESSSCSRRRWFMRCSERPGSLFAGHHRQQPRSHSPTSRRWLTGHRPILPPSPPRWPSSVGSSSSCSGCCGSALSPSTSVLRCRSDSCSALA